MYGAFLDEVNDYVFFNSAIDLKLRVFSIKTEELVFTFMGPSFLDTVYILFDTSSFDLFLTSGPL